MGNSTKEIEQYIEQQDAQIRASQATQSGERRYILNGKEI